MLWETIQNLGNPFFFFFFFLSSCLLLKSILLIVTLILEPVRISASNSVDFGKGPSIVFEVQVCVFHCRKTAFMFWWLLAFFWFPRLLWVLNILFPYDHLKHCCLRFHLAWIKSPMINCHMLTSEYLKTLYFNFNSNYCFLSSFHCKAQPK